MTPDEPTEMPLEGGIANRGLVVRVGDTVRRPLRATSTATHALLQHLARVGFEGAPRFLGLDGRHREVLTYIPGDVATAPYPNWALTDSALQSVVALLRRYHEAIAGFDPAPYAWPQSPPPPFAGQLVSHNDPNLDNVVFWNGQAIAFIDFDLASPGSALWDLAAAARLWAPLRCDADITDSRRGQSLRRFRLIVESYGLTNVDRQLLVDAVRMNHDWLYSIISSAAALGNQGYLTYWRESRNRIDRTYRWYEANNKLLLDALAGPTQEGL